MWTLVNTIKLMKQEEKEQEENILRENKCSWKLKN